MKNQVVLSVIVDLLYVLILSLAMPGSASRSVPAAVGFLSS